MEFSDEERKLVEDAIEARKSYEKEDFYCATDDYRWGHASTKRLSEATQRLEIPIFSYFISKSVPMDIAKVIMKHLNYIEFCKELLKIED